MIRRSKSCSDGKMKKVLLDIKGSDVKIYPLRDKKSKGSSRGRSKSRGHKKHGRGGSKRRSRSKGHKSAGGCGAKPKRVKKKRSASRKAKKAGACGAPKPKKRRVVKKKRAC